MTGAANSTTRMDSNPMADAKQNTEPRRKRHLALSRKAGEAIHVDGPALVEVRHISRSRVTLLVHAAKETKVVRKDSTGLTPEES